MLISILLLPWTRLHAQTEPGMLARELKALSDAKLLSLQDASESELRALVAKGEQLHLQGRDDEAAVVLLEALESPRFADFRDFDVFAAGEHTAAVALLQLGSRQSARRYLEHAIARGASGPYYGPAVRAYVDVALALGDAPAAADWLQKQRPASEDALNELRYLRARALYDQGEKERASPLLEQVGKRSRFFASAQYLLGAIAAEQKQYKRAEQRFCAIADAGKDNRYKFYVDDRFFELQDLARLGLGRAAHEQRGRGDDAFYYYFQVPRDSKRLPESLFESAYATYEAQDHDTALDLLDQLQAHFKTSPYSDEAAILRGYVSLGRCEFEQADRYFVQFERGFAPLVNELDRLLANPVRRRQLYDELLAAERGVPAESKTHETLLALLRVDPDFYRLHEQLGKLDAESSRAGRVADELDATRARVNGSGAPRAIDVSEEQEPAEARLRRDVELAHLLSRSLAGELDALRAAGAKGAQLSEIERALSQAGSKLDRIEERAARLRAEARAGASASGGASATGGTGAGGVAAALAEDVDAARALPERVQQVREQLAQAADASAERALRGLRERLHGMLRRAKIGRIDAVMGSKRRIELQIESLAAGRFPPELRDPLRVQGLLDDDEEYWPFEGEDWPDEYEERYRESDERAERGE